MLKLLWGEPEHLFCSHYGLFRYDVKTDDVHVYDLEPDFITKIHDAHLETLNKMQVFILGGPKNGTNTYIFDFLSQNLSKKADMMTSRNSPTV